MRTGTRRKKHREKKVATPATMTMYRVVPDSDVVVPDAGARLREAALTLARAEVDLGQAQAHYGQALETWNTLTAPVLTTGVSHGVRKSKRRRSGTATHVKAVAPTRRRKPLAQGVLSNALLTLLAKRATPLRLREIHKILPVTTSVDSVSMSLLRLYKLGKIARPEPGLYARLPQKGAPK